MATIQTTDIQRDYHHNQQYLSFLDKIQKATKTKVTYSFLNHFHPYVGSFISRLNKGELEEVLSLDTQKLKNSSFFPSNYTSNPDGDDTIAVIPPIKEVDFSYNGPYAIYNWELFFHIPLAIANQLRINQRFAEAQKWFHYIFDPTTNEKPDPTDPTARYWKFLLFRNNTDPQLITDMLTSLSKGENTEEVEALKSSIKAWKKTPFSPHEVAKFRPLAYQFRVIMSYLDNLIEWGDSLFRQFTIETINEAEQLYILASNILGDRPEEIPNLKKRPIRTYKQIKNQLDEFGNVLVEMENEMPLNSNVSGLGGSSATEGVRSLFGISKQLYFCIPENQKLLTYWDTVRDRLFKIRNCMDIEGNIRPLPLFQPPIDPGMLVKAVAGGISLDSIIGGLNQPVSNARYTVMVQKALQICGEVRNMGTSLLAAIEKGDAERLQIIRQEHELNILTLSKDIKYLQWKETESGTDALLKSRETIYQRYRHYQLILGKEESEFSAFEALALDRELITEENFEDRFQALIGQYDQEIDIEDYREDKHGLNQIAVDVASEITGAIANITGAEDLAEHFAFNTGEKLDLNVFGPLATQLKVAGWVTKTLVAPLLGLIPQFDVHGTPLGVGGAAEFGGEQLSKGAEYVAEGMVQLSHVSTGMGAQALKLAGYQRRVQDWIFQSNQAAKDLQQIGFQIMTSLIKEQISRKEYENHGVQIEQSQAVETFLKEQKFSNEALYLWMQNNVSKLYYDYYKLAFDVAKQAETTMKHELMRPELEERSFIKYNYWDAGYKGLLSGETLCLDLQRMEVAYLEQHKREFELSKAISLVQLNPLALLQLKTEGSCEIMIPEWIFDMDCPGHYMRRIKSMAVSIPCVTGPYTSINCTLSLQRSSIRKTAVIAEPASYARTDSEDIRFKDYFGTIQSIVTSNAQNDSGVFNLNFSDSRFVPFEYSGAISTWRLELNTDIRQFDYNTISDVILHMRYTARQGGGILKSGATQAIQELIFANTGLVRMFNLKQDFPNDWYQYTSTDNNPDPVNFKTILKKEHLSYITQMRDIDSISIQLWHIDKDNQLQALDSSAILTDLTLLTDQLNDVNEQYQGALELDGTMLEKEGMTFMIFNPVLSV